MYINFTLICRMVYTSQMKKETLPHIREEGNLKYGRELYFYLSTYSLSNSFAWRSLDSRLRYTSRSRSTLLLLMFKAVHSWCMATICEKLPFSIFLQGNPLMNFCITYQEKKTNTRINNWTCVCEESFFQKLGYFSKMVHTSEEIWYARS